MWTVCAAIAIVGGLVAPRSADANILCKWFGRCFYESLGFQIRVVDKETGQPLADVHALAEWVSYAVGRRNGPQMVQDVTSGADGMLVFLPWGPIRGYRDGLVLNSDPVITLFKPGYRTATLNNAFPIGAGETDRVRGFQQNGQTFALESFRGTGEQWAEELWRVGRPMAAPSSDELLLRFREPYLNRLRRVWAERQKLPQRLQSEARIFQLIEGILRLLENGRR